MIRKALLTAAIVVAGATAPASAIQAQPVVHVPGWALCPEWWATAKQVGWKTQDIWMLDYVMWKESRCNPNVHNPDDPMSGSYGLTQVNGGWSRWLRERGVLNKRADLFTPATNLLAALHIHNYAKDRYGKGWNPWNLG